jgi:hypothetical protein
VKERNAGLRILSVSADSSKKKAFGKDHQIRGTYSEDQKASDDGGIFGRGQLFIGSSGEALLGATRAGNNDTLVGSHDVI